MLELKTHVPENMSLPLKEFMWQQQRERNGILQNKQKKGAMTSSMWGVHTLVYGGISHPSGHLLHLPLVNSVLHIFVVLYIWACALRIQLI